MGSPRLALGCRGDECGGKGRRAPCAWKRTLEKRSGQRTLPFFPGSELTPSTTSAPPEPTLLMPKGVPGGSHSHAEPSPSAPALLECWVCAAGRGRAQCCTRGRCTAHRPGTPGGLQAAPRDTSGHICGSGKSCGTGERGRNSCAVLTG